MAGHVKLEILWRAVGYYLVPKLLEVDARKYCFDVMTGQALKDALGQRRKRNQICLWLARDPAFLFVRRAL
jgi:hypothetical protein